jgi:hypothetical protein
MILYISVKHKTYLIDELISRIMNFSLKYNYFGTISIQLSKIRNILQLFARSAEFYNKGASKNHLIGCSFVGTMIRIKPLFLIDANRKKAVFRGAHKNSLHLYLIIGILNIVFDYKQ